MLDWKTLGWKPNSCYTATSVTTGTVSSVFLIAIRLLNMRIRQSQRNTFTLRPLVLCLYVFHFNVVMMSSQPTLTPRRRRRWCLSWRFSFTLETTLTSLTCWEPAPSEVRGVTTSTFSSLRIRFACEIFLDWFCRIGHLCRGHINLTHLHSCFIVVCHDLWLWILSGRHICHILMWWLTAVPGHYQSLNSPHLPSIWRRDSFYLATNLLCVCSILFSCLDLSIDYNLVWGFFPQMYA